MKSCLWPDNFYCSQHEAKKELAFAITQCLTERYWGDFWLSAKENFQLTDSEILKASVGVHPRFLLGARAGKGTRLVVLDINAGSKHHLA